MDQAIDVKEVVVLLATGRMHTCEYLGGGKYILDRTIVVERKEIENKSVYDRYRQKQCEPSQQAERIATLEMEIAEIKKMVAALTERLGEVRKQLAEDDEKLTTKKRRKSNE